MDSILNEKNELAERRVNTFEDIGLNEQPRFIESKKNQKKIISTEDGLKKSIVIRLQDQQLQELRDDGMCLSMHQPYASLLIAGIKKHEGRSWYSPYRGRLWIHAASKQPNELEIKEIETFYKCFYANSKIEFPSSYPTSCLLGYVNFVDCLNSKTYKTNYPMGESDSEFVFIVENPKELVVKIPISGQHKIFKLDKKVHATAKNTSVAYVDDL